MSEDFDRKLRSTLKPVDPGEEFTRRVIERVAGASVHERPSEASDEPRRGTVATSERGAGALHSARRRPAWVRKVWIPAALAASLAVVAVGLHQQALHQQALREQRIHQGQQQQLQAGLAARAQVLEALQVTSQKLDLAYRLVNTSSHDSAPVEAPGT